MPVVPRGLVGAAERASSMPASLEISVERGLNCMQIKIDVLSAIQVVVPAKDGYALVAEAEARFTLTGSVAGMAVNEVSPGILEVVDGA